MNESVTPRHHLKAFKKKLKMRYTITINFRYGFVDKTGQYGKDWIKPTEPLIESVKTLKEALSYKEFIDSSVESAFITDNVTKKQIQF